MEEFGKTNGEKMYEAMIATYYIKLGVKAVLFIGILAVIVKYLFF